MAGEFGPEWLAWTWVAVVGGAILAAVAVRLSGRARLPALPFQHAAAAAIVGVVGWTLALQLPSVVQLVTAAYAGIDGAPGQGAYQMLAVLHVVVVAAAAVAVLALPYRHVWAVPLGIGVCLAATGWSVIGLFSMLSFAAQYPEANPQLFWAAVTNGLQVVPSVAGIVLLLWPFVRGTARPIAAETARGADSELEEVVALDHHDLQPDRSAG